MARDATEKQRLSQFNKLADPTFSRLLTLSTNIKGACAGAGSDNPCSLSAARSKAQNKADKKLMEKHEKSVKGLGHHIDILLKELQSIVLAKGLHLKYDSLFDIGQADPKFFDSAKFFDSGDKLVNLEPPFLQSLHPNGRKFYEVPNGDYPNACMIVISQHLPEVCGDYATMRSLLKNK